HRGAIGRAELIVVKTVFLIPEAGAAEAVDRVRDGYKVFEKFRRDILIRRVFGGKFKGGGQHDRAIRGHPRRAICLFKRTAIRQWFGAVEKADVVEAEEATGKDLLAGDVFAVDPPGEVDEEFLEDTLEKNAVALAPRGSDLVNAHCGPRVNRRIDVAEREFIGRNLAARVCVPFAQQQNKLLLGEFGIDLREGEHMESEVPRCVPWELPGVRHRDDVAVVELQPVAVAAVPAGVRRLRKGRIAFEPFEHAEMIKLLRPQQARAGLFGDAHAGRRVGVDLVKLVGLCNPLLEDRVEVDRAGFRGGSQAKAKFDSAAGGDLAPVVCGGFGAFARGIHRTGLAMDDEAVESVFYPRRSVGRLIEALEIGFVAGEKKLVRFGDGFECAASERFMRAGQAHIFRLPDRWFRPVAFTGSSPGPRITKPDGRKNVKGPRLRSTVIDTDADQNVVRRGFRILNRDVEVAALVEDAGVEKFVLAIVLRAPAVFLNELFVGEGLLRVLVESLHVRVSRGVFEEEVVLFDVFA